jgi:ABC-type multidrug transport system ATPase subunit
MAAIEIKNLQKKFRGKTIINNLSLDIESGEYLAMLGPNGAGKTTLIRILSTLLRPTNGVVTINGYDLKEEAIDVRNSIGVLLHSSFLYDELTLEENIGFYQKMFVVKKDEEKIKDLLENQGLFQLLCHKVGEFSRGTKQKANLATILLLDPPVLLLDEPDEGLGPKDQDVILNLLRRLHDKEKTLLLVTNNVELGYNVGDRFVILLRGTIAYECEKKDITVEVLKEKYHSLIEGTT